MQQVSSIDVPGSNEARADDLQARTLTERRFATALAKRLSAADRTRIVEHFDQLGSADRYLRFGSPMGTEVLRLYVDGIDFHSGVVFGVHADDLELVGVAHVAAGSGVAEIGLSVLDDWRNAGIGQLLLERAAGWARAQGITTLFMHCLAENGAIRRLAKRVGMNVVAANGEADAHLALAPAQTGSASREAMLDRVALFDFCLKRQVLATRRLLQTISGQ